MAIVLDAKLLCECGSQAKYRMPPTRSAQVAKLLGAVLTARGGNLDEWDCLVAPDGFKGDWEEKVSKAAGPGLRATKQFAVYSQESVEGRMARSADTTLELVETLFFFTKGEPLNVKFQARKLVPKQSTRANFIGPLALPSYSAVDAVWNIRVSEKKGLYGPNNLPLPGGKCPVEHPRPTTVTKRHEIVPAFFHEGPATLATELAHAIGAKAVIDLTPGSGHWAMYAIRYRIPYVGLVFTNIHAQMLHARLVSQTLTAMADSNDDMYDAGMASLLKDLPVSGGQSGSETPGATTGSTSGTTGTPGTSSTAGSGSGSGSADGRETLIARIAQLRGPQAVPGGEDDEEVF